MSNKIFELNGDTLVAIDWSNVYGWFDDLGWEIDPKKLYCYLGEYPEVFAKNFYFGKDEKNQKTKGLHDEIKKGVFLCSVNKLKDFLIK